MLLKVWIDRYQPQYLISTEVDRNTPWSTSRDTMLSGKNTIERDFQLSKHHLKYCVAGASNVVTTTPPHVRSNMEVCWRADIAHYGKCSMFCVKYIIMLAGECTV